MSNLGDCNPVKEIQKMTNQAGAQLVGMLLDHVNISGRGHDTLIKGTVS